MVKKKFAECEMTILHFGRQEIIETSSFDGVIDEFYDEAGNRINEEGGQD